MQNAFMQVVPEGRFLDIQDLRKLGEIGSRAAIRLAGIQYQLASVGIEGTLEHARLLTGTPDLAKLVQAQSALARDCGSRLLAIGRDAADVLSETRDEWVAWMRNGFEGGAGPAPQKVKDKPRGGARRAAARKAA